MIAYHVVHAKWGGVKNECKDHRSIRYQGQSIIIRVYGTSNIMPCI